MKAAHKPSTIVSFGPNTHILVLSDEMFNEFMALDGDTWRDKRPNNYSVSGMYVEGPPWVCVKNGVSWLNQYPHLGRAVDFMPIHHASLLLLRYL